MLETKYTKNEEAKTIVVEREFAASQDKVWKAWTDSTILEKWWAPKPWLAITESFDFTEGGRWHYYMKGPAGEQSWALFNYEKIKPLQSFFGQDAFCDKNAVINTNMPSMDWDVQFTKKSSTTLVTVTITFPDVASMNKIIEMGFKEGFAMAHENLDVLLATV